MKWSTIRKALIFFGTAASIQIVIGDPLGWADWLDEHYPIGGRIDSEDRSRRR